MRNLCAFLRLPVATQILALEAALALLQAWLLVRYVPMRYWNRSLGTMPESPPTPVEHERSGLHRKAQRVARIVRKVACRLPFRSSCLSQAMAAQWILRRRRIQSQLIIGVRRGKTSEAAAEFHAWLMAAGKCVIGMGEVETYSPFPPTDVPQRSDVMTFGVWHRRNLRRGSSRSRQKLE